MPVTLSALLRLALRLALIAGIAIAVSYGLDWAMSSTDTVAEDIATGMMIGTIALFLIVYALLISVPFVPGIEIGIALLVLQGDVVAPYVFLATVAGLSLAFLAGHVLPDRWLAATLADLRLRRASRFVLRMGSLDRLERLKTLETSLPRWLAPLALRGRYLLLALLLNLPGNGLIGGGGGIALVAGLSGVFAPGWTLLTIALAVAPVPLAVWLWGGEMLSGWALG